MFEISVKRVHAPEGIKRLRLVRNGFSHRGGCSDTIPQPFHMRGIDIINHVLLTGGRI